MVPRVVVRLRRAVRRLARQGEVVGQSGEEIAASWRHMIERVDRHGFEVERRLGEAERALNSVRFR